MQLQSNIKFFMKLIDVSNSCTCICISQYYHTFLKYTRVNFIIFINKYNLSLQTPFDPNMMKKKKKKKKVPFDLDAAMGDPEGATDGAPTQETTEEPEENKSENQREKVDDGKK